MSNPTYTTLSPGLAFISQTCGWSTKPFAPPAPIKALHPEINSTTAPLTTLVILSAAAVLAHFFTPLAVFLAWAGGGMLPLLAGFSALTLSICLRHRQPALLGLGRAAFATALLLTLNWSTVVLAPLHLTGAGLPLDLGIFFLLSLLLARRTR